MRPQILATVALVLVAAAGASGQNYQPTPVPRTGAIGRAWYRDADPLFFAGDLYYPAGPTVYFNGDTMVPTGTYDGVMLYTDATIEPYTVVLVPVTNRLMRRYERVLEGHLPSRRANRSYYPNEYEESEAPAEEAQPQEPGYGYERGGVPPTPQAAEVPLEPFLVETARKPLDNLGIWVSFQGYRWRHAGEAVPLDPGKMPTVGDYFGVHVYADPRTPYVIYIPSRGNLVAPFRRTE